MGTIAVAPEAWLSPGPDRTTAGRAVRHPFTPTEISAVAFACDMTALPAEQRTAHARTTQALFGAVDEVEELPDGFAFRIPASGDLLRSAAAFVILERLCCPFFGFSIDLAPGADSFRLGVTGPDGVKPFIRAELAGAFPAASGQG